MNACLPTENPAHRWTIRLEAWPGVTGGFTQRGPHDPTDPQSGFNLGHTRNAAHRQVDQRRRQALRDLGLGGQPLVCADQVHGDHVAVARRRDLPHLRGRWGYPYYPRTDALITAERGLALLLFFADCCPVFLYAPGDCPTNLPHAGDDRRYGPGHRALVGVPPTVATTVEARAGTTTAAVGLAHCGWRGAVADLAGKTVAALQREFAACPATMQAVVGPCIGVECYEVGPEVVAAVQRVGGEAALRPYGARTHLDLLTLNALLLERAGVPAAAIRIVDHCTRCGPLPLYSWRREGPRTGRLGAFLALR